MKLYLVRHGETIENTRKIVMGQRHGRLGKAGKLQAKRLANLFKKHKFDAIYSSDLRRAADTAKEIAKYHPHQIIYSKDLREGHFGKLQGKSRDYLKIVFSDLPGTFMTKKAPGGESPIELKRRVKRFTNHLLKEHKNDSVLIITHGGVIRMFLAILKKISAKRVFESVKIQNAAGFLIAINKNKTVAVKKINSS